MKLKTFFFIMCLTLIQSSYASALNLCLNARTLRIPLMDSKEGHVFLTVEDEERFLRSYGFWPDTIQQGSVAVNFKYDKSLSYLLDSYSPVHGEAKICQSLDSSQLQNLDSDIKGYVEKFGDWSTFKNNCTIFAVYFYNKYTSDKFPAQMFTPNSA